LAPELACSSKR